jgi:hypothetical protein
VLGQLGQMGQEELIVIQSITSLKKLWDKNEFLEIPACLELEKNMRYNFSLTNPLIFCQLRSKQSINLIGKILIFSQIG